IAVYTILGGLSVILYRLVYSFTSGGTSKYVQLITGLLVILAGLATFIGSKSNFFCRIVNQISFSRKELNAAVFGFLIGIAPCAPLLGILGYLAATSPNFVGGLIGGLAFGAGTLISPVIPLGFFSGYLSEKLAGRKTAFVVLRILSGIILLYFGLWLVFKVF
ncbi:MAG: sulfite exporter TauE/SafE family protein, partial [Elusimicrobiota bacterium]